MAPANSQSVRLLESSGIRYARLLGGETRANERDRSLGFIYNHRSTPKAKASPLSLLSLDVSLIAYQN